MVNEPCEYRNTRCNDKKTMNDYIIPFTQNFFFFTEMTIWKNNHIITVLHQYSLRPFTFQHNNVNFSLHFQYVMRHKIHETRFRKFLTSVSLCW